MRGPVSSGRLRCLDKDTPNEGRGNGSSEKNKAHECADVSEVVGMSRFELLTLAVSGRCSPTELHA